MANNKMATQRSIYPRWLLNFLDSKNVSVGALSKVTCLPESVFSGAHISLPLDAYLRLFEWAAREFSEPHLGIKLALSSNPDDFGLFGFLTISAETVGELCELAERYQRILMQGETIEFIRHGEQIEMRFSITSGLSDHLTQDVEFTLASMVVVMNRAYSEAKGPLKTCFTHDDFGPMADYHSIFGDNVKFGQPANSLWFEMQYWDAPLKTANSTLLTVLKDQANKLLAEIEDHADFLSYVRFLIGSRLGDHDFNAEVLACDLNMSSRTLHRKLKQEKTSFMDVRLELVMDVAKSALLNEKVSVADLAQSLGYSESSAFVRVFKRLQGQSPLQYRKEHSV